ncbi:hypothetical protein IE81DRAFT_321708 [Ceraceosorus guamensis]|uniref:HAD-like protein n=1 Tax=Ceraceosorus guamensis TaxID=1522189 RepID=A0A316W2P3_9BASI|nr:hypothetical protein IE81DRAFT_321708 [Ceraceosorus guamensis]PWN44050.1 hypothetical protein IE81DRAFT_321708 [Ceraceosorus guamensis]
MAIRAPNYGYPPADPTRWWTQLISDMFSQSDLYEDNKHHLPTPKELEQTLAPRILQRFSSAKAYTLFDDTVPFLLALRNLKEELPERHRLAICIASDSDSRIISALSELLDQASTHGRVPDLRPLLGIHSSSSKGSPACSLASARPIFGHEIGYTKPDARFFWTARNMAWPVVATTQQEQRTSDAKADSARDGKTVYVGDSHELDYIGAREAGLDALWIGRSALAPDDYAATRAQHRIESLVDVVNVLRTSYEEEGVIVRS